MTQCDHILKHLKTGRGITPLAALERWGCFRLAARIAELKRQGHTINCALHKTSNGKRVGLYWLKP